MNAVIQHKPQTTAVIPYSDIERMAGALVASNLFGLTKKEHAIALMLVAQAEGLHPATVAVDYDFIQGKPSKKPVAMLRDFIRGGGKVEWHALNDAEAEATFSHPQGGTVRVRWDMAKAKQAQLTGKEMWKKYPAAMLRSRCVSEGLRAVFPAATGGLYTPEEVQDMEPERDVTPERVTVAEAVREVASATALTDEEVTEHLDAIAAAEGGEQLRSAYVAACEHANQARDKQAKERFIAAYNERKSLLVPV